MTIYSTTEIQEDNGALRVKFDLGDDGRIELYFPPEEGSFYTDGFVCGSWYSKDGGSFDLMNNLDKYGNGPGVEVKFRHEDIDDAFDYFWQKRVEADRARRDACHEQEDEMIDAYL